jgi:S-adenosylmethionine:diacylglycerol 3-amino-3-carboxypropyl transferase
MKNIVIIVGVIATLTGCVTSPKRMNINDLDRYTVDCEYGPTQQVFLETQMPTLNDRIVSTNVTSSVVGSLVAWKEGSYDQHIATRNGRYAAVTRVKQDQLYRQCAPNYTNPNVCDLAFPESPACQRLRR